MKCLFRRFPMTLGYPLYVKGFVCVSTQPILSCAHFIHLLLYMLYHSMTATITGENLASQLREQISKPVAPLSRQSSNEIEMQGKMHQVQQIHGKLLKTLRATWQSEENCVVQQHSIQETL